jgi:c-di-GMP-binding flagellar brake protein YcgR
MALFGIRRGEAREDGAGLDPGLYFAINDTVKLEYKGNFYSSRVEDLAGGALWVARPFASGRDLEIGEGEDVTLVGSTRTNLITFHSRVEACEQRGPWLLRVKLQKCMGHLQRRDYARISDRLPVTFWVEEDAQAFGEADAVTRDVSGGGMSMLMERLKAPMQEATLGFQLRLPDGGPVTARGQVMRVDPTEARNLCVVGVRFSRILETDRKRLVRHVNLRQTAQRRQGAV